MAKEKKGFILYADLIHTIEKMPVEKAGELFLHILNYVNDKNPISEDLIINLTFEPIKQQLKRDLNHWESVRVKRSEAGLASAKKRQQKATKRTSVKSVQQSSTNPTVIVNDNVKVIVNDNVINKSRIELKLDEFYKFRKEMKKTILESSKEAFKKSLIKLSCNDEQTAIEILEQSIANGWQGIFELKQQTNGTTNNKQVSKYHN